jgi:uncharacterized protein YfbU (UPF0304 family)
MESKQDKSVFYLITEMEGIVTGRKDESGEKPLNRILFDVITYGCDEGRYQAYIKKRDKLQAIINLLDKNMKLLNTFYKPKSEQK